MIAAYRRMTRIILRLLMFDGMTASARVGAWGVWAKRSGRAQVICLG